MSTARPLPIAAIFLGILTTFNSLHATPVRFLSWDDAIAARKIRFVDGKGAAELDDLHPQKRSKAVNWTSGEVPPVLAALDRTSTDGKPVTAPIKLTSDLKAPLVLILPDPAHPSGLRTFVIDDDSGSFGWGTFRFINATGKDLLVRNDKVTKSLPNTWKAVDLNPGGDSRNMGIQLAARDNLKAILYSAVWEYDPNVRKLIIVVPGADAGSGALNLKIVPEDRRSVAPVVAPPASVTP